MKLGARSPGATVTILDVARGTSRTLTTDDAGAYSAPNLIPGAYSMPRLFGEDYKPPSRKNIRLKLLRNCASI